MELKKTNEFVIGTASAAGAYLLWGVLTVYWKSIISVPSDQIIAHRVLWCFLFLVLVFIRVGSGLRYLLANGGII